MAAKTAKRARDKTATQKKILIGLMLPLLLAVFYAYHTLTKHSPSPTTAPPAATTTAAATTPASTVAAAPAATTASPATGATAPTGSAVPTGAPTVPPDTGKVMSLTLLPRRDPFSGSTQSSAAVASVTSPPVTVAQQPQQPKQTQQPKQPKQTQHKAVQHKKTQSKKSQSKQTQPKQTSPPPTKAVLVLDRTLLRVRLHKGFGTVAGSPTSSLFWVVSLTHKTARIIIVGKFRAHTLRVDTPLTLTDLQGNPHMLMLLPEGTPLPALASSVKAAATTTTTGK
jgi:hypothetical protein